MLGSVGDVGVVVISGNAYLILKYRQTVARAGSTAALKQKTLGAGVLACKDFVHLLLKVYLIHGNKYSTGVQKMHARLKILLKVVNTGLEDLHVLLAVDVNGNGLSSSLRVSHLTESSAVCGSDTFDGCVRTVDVVLLIH